MNLTVRELTLSVRVQLSLTVRPLERDSELLPLAIMCQRVAQLRAEERLESMEELNGELAPVDLDLEDQEFDHRVLAN